MRSSTFYNCLDDVKNQPEFCNSKESKTFNSLYAGGMSSFPF